MLPALGRLMFRHHRTVLAAWVVVTALGLAAVAGALGTEGLFDRLTPESAPQVPGPAETGRHLLDRAEPAGPTVDLVLDHVDPTSPAVRSAVTAAAHDVAALPVVLAVQQPFAGGATADALIASDGRAVMVTATLVPDLSAHRRTAAMAAVTSRLLAVAARIPGSTATVGGTQELLDSINKQLRADLESGELVALPVSLLALVFVFGGVLAAGLPVLGAIASIGGGLAALLGLSFLMDLSTTVPNVVSVLGLGLCIDYGLLMVSRHREERRRDAPRDRSGGHGLRNGTAEEEALGRTVGTAGRTVLFSGVTVAVSLSGLLFFHATILRGVGVAGISVVLVALLVALTLVPALLAAAGDRLLRPGLPGRVPGLRRWVRRLGDVAPEYGAFTRLAARVQRRPVVVVVGVVTLLLLLGAPALSLRTATDGERLLPRGAAQRSFVETVDARFPAAVAPELQAVAVAGTADLDRWAAEQAAHRAGVARVGAAQEVGTGPDRVAVVGIRLSVSPTSTRAQDLARDLQATRPGFPLDVVGYPASDAAFADDLRSGAPLAAGVVVLATFALLFLMTGSVLVPVKALVMDTVSLGASFGVLVWVFQDGHLQGLLGFDASGTIETTIPALVLAFAFGLSMDYEVFLLSRIKERHDAGATNDEAVAGGLQRSGRIITSAALVVVIVFVGFASGRLLVIKELGVALAVAVVVDATAVRMLLVPATMTLLREANWWAPPRLRRLHDRFGLRES